MNAAPEAVLRRVRAVVDSGGAERLDPEAVRALLAELLYDGHGVPDWHEDAACRDHDPALFFPETGNEEEVTKAKAVCADCPVRAACLRDVMAWERPSARFGVVGGLSVNERHQVHRASRPKRGAAA